MHQDMGSTQDWYPSRTQSTIEPSQREVIRKKVELVTIPLGSSFTIPRCKAFLQVLELAWQPTQQPDTVLENSPCTPWSGLCLTDLWRTKSN